MNTCDLLCISAIIHTIGKLCKKNPLILFKPSRCIKASYYIPENRLNFPTTKGFRTKIFAKLVTNTWQFSLIFKPHQVIFIHYMSRIATAIRGLYWMKMTMVNAGLKGLKMSLYVVIFYYIVLFSL